MKRLALIFAFLAIALPLPAQQPPELACPVGYSPVPGHTTLDATTGKRRENVCERSIDGDFLLNGISIFGGLGGGGVTVVASNPAQVPACIATASFDTCVNAAVAVLAVLSPVGGIVDATGLKGPQLVMTGNVLTGSDTMLVRLLLPPGNISRAANKSFKMFFGSQMLGMGKCFGGATCTKITGTGINDIGITYGGSGAYLQYPVLKNFTILSGAYGGGTTGTGIDFALAQSGYINGVFSYANSPLVIGGVGTPGCSCYNRIDYSDFRADNAGVTKAVQLLPGANSNVFTGGSYWGHTGVYYLAYGDTFYGPDMENSTVGFEAAGNGLHVYDGYWEAVTTGLLIDAGIMGTSLINPHPGVLVADNSGNVSNWYFGVGDEAVGTSALLPLRFGVQDQINFGTSSLNGYNGIYALRGDRGGTIAGEWIYEQAANRLGYNGNAPLWFGFGKSYGGFNATGSGGVAAFGTVPAPTLSCAGQTPGATYSRRMVAYDWNGHATLPGTAATTDCANVPSVAHPLTITPSTALNGVWEYDYLTDTTHSVALATRGAVLDQGGVYAAYASPTRDATADWNIAGILGVGSLSGPITISGTETSMSGPPTALAASGAGQGRLGISSTGNRPVYSYNAGANANLLLSSDVNLTALKVYSCQISLGDGLNAIGAGTYPVAFQCLNDTGATITVTGINCATDNAGTTTCDVATNAPNSLLNAVITGNTGTWVAGAQSGTTTITAGQWLKGTFVADGTTKIVTIDIAGTRP